MRSRRSILGLVIALVLSALTARAEEAWTLQQLMELLAAVTEVDATFIERKEMTVLETPLETSGVLHYRAPDELEKEVLYPEPMRYTITRDQIVIDQPGGKQQIFPLDQYPLLRVLTESLRATLAGDQATLERFYRLTFSGEPEDWTLRLEPTDPDIARRVVAIVIRGNGTQNPRRRNSRERRGSQRHDDPTDGGMTRTTKELVLLVWFTVLSICGWLTLFRTPLVSEITGLLPGGGALGERLELVRSTAAARLILIGLEGGSEADRAAISHRMAAILRATGLFVRIANGETRPAQDDVRGVFTRRYLLSPEIDTERFTQAGLHRALEVRLQELRSPLSTIGKELLPDDPTGEGAAILRAWKRTVGASPSRQGVWFSPDGARALLLAETRASGFDPKAQAPVLAAVRNAFQAARDEMPKDAEDVRLLIAGPGALASQSERRIRGEAGMLGFASIVFVVLILALAFRSLRIVLLSPLPLLTAALAAIAAVGLVFGRIHGVTLGFGATLLGIAIDYPVHLFSHLRVGETASSTLRRVWPTMRLCVATTAIGYVAMIDPGFDGLSQLAVFSITGLVTAALVTRWVLPALLPGGWNPPRSLDEGRRLARLLRLRELRGLRVGRAILLLVALLGFLAVDPPVWENDLASLSPIPRSVLATDARLRADLGAPEAGHMLIIEGSDREQVLESSEGAVARLAPLVEQGILAGFDAPSLYLPSIATQRKRQRALPPGDELRAALAGAVVGLPFRVTLFEPFLADVEAARTGPLVTYDDILATAVGSRLSSLLVPGASGWTGLVLLSGLADPATVAATVAERGVAYVDMRAETNRAMARFRDAALARVAAGAALLAIVLFAGVRSGHRAFVVLLPMALALASDIAILSLQGERLTLFHLVSLLLIVGIGIDYGLFFSRPEDDREERKRTLRGLLVCSSSTAAGFFVLCFSSLPVLSAIGRTVTVGVVAALVFAALISRPAEAAPRRHRGGTDG